MRKIMHLLTGGGVGGIETLISNYAEFSHQNNIFVFAWNGGENAKKIKNFGKKVFILNIDNRKPVLYLKDLLKICEDYNIDVIVSHHNAPLTELILLKLKRKKPNIKVVFYAHCSAEELTEANHQYLRWLNKWLTNRLLKKSDLIIAISNFVKNTIIEEYGINSSRIITVYNAVPISSYTSNITKKSNNSPLNIIYVGRLIKDKGVELTLQALSLVKNRSFHFYVVGNGPYKSNLELISESLNISDQVTFLGERNDVPQLLQKADVFIHVPFLGEGFGITIVEAMAAGKLCICARSGAIPEIITDKVNGLLIDQFNKEQLTQAIDYVSDNFNTDTIFNIRKNAQEESKKYNITIYSELVDKVYEQL